MNKSVLAAILAIIIIGGGLIWYFTSAKKTSENSTTNTNQTTNNSTGTETNTPSPSPNPPISETPSPTPPSPTPTAPSPTPGAMEQVKSFTVTGSNFKFDPNTITVNKGDKVKITFVNSAGFHDWKIDEFGAATKQINAPGTEVIEFTADKTGTFEYYCSVGKHREMGMVGKLVVQ